MVRPRQGSNSISPLMAEPMRPWIIDGGHNRHRVLSEVGYKVSLKDEVA